MNVIYSDAHGQLSLMPHDVPVLQVKLTGFLTTEMASLIVAEHERVIGHFGMMRGAFDLSEASSYTPEARSLLTAFCLNNRERIEEQTFLSSSAMFNMGLNAVSIAFKAVGLKMSATTDPRVFEERVAAMIANATPTGKIDVRALREKQR